MAIKIKFYFIFIIYILFKINILCGGNLLYSPSLSDSIKTDTTLKVKKTPSEANVRIYGENYLLDDAAFTQGKKTFYYKNYNILLRKISYGVNDNLDFYFITLPYLGLKELRIGIGGKYKIQLTKNIAMAVKSDYYNFNTLWRNSVILSVGDYKNNASIAFNKLNEVGATKSFDKRNVFTFHGRLHMKNSLFLQFENIFYSNTNSFSIFSLDVHKNSFKFSIGYIYFNELNTYETYDFQQGAVFTLQVPLVLKK